MKTEDFDEFYNAYITCALWSTTMSSHAEKRFIDLQQQGLMRSWTKKRGIDRVWHPRDGYPNWTRTSRQAEEIAKYWSQSLGGK